MHRRGTLGKHRLHGLEERYVVPDAQRLGMRHRQRERLRQLAHGVQAPVLAVLLLQDVLLRGGQQAEPLRRRAAGPLRPVEAVEETAADLGPEHHGDRFVLVEGRAPGAAALRVGRERGLQLVGQPQVVHHEPAGLVLEHAVDPCDGLHQPVAAHRLVDVHRNEGRRSR